MVRCRETRSTEVALASKKLVRRCIIYSGFTNRARKVLQLTEQEGRQSIYQCINTEQVLYGLVKEGSGFALNVLKNLAVDLDQLRTEVEKTIKYELDVNRFSFFDFVFRKKTAPSLERVPITPRTKKLLEYSMEEARLLNHDNVGTEHLLLGMLREHKGIAGQILMKMGLRTKVVRDEILKMLRQSGS